MANLSTVDVDFTATPVCKPDPVIVKKNTDDGVKWVCKNDDYTFTGVTIDSVTYTPASTGGGEFKDVVITSNGKKSTMTITDTVSDTTDHIYSLVYTLPNGTTQTFDPKIRNQN
jgi:hypothetical protein